MRFESPLWFLAAAVVALGVVAVFIFRQTGGSGRPAILFSNLPPLLRQKPTWRVRGRKLLGLLRVLTLLALIGALARPQLGRSDSVVSSKGIDIILVVDTSGSMAAEDFGERKTRLYHATDVMIDFAKRRAADRIGLISFGLNAYTRCPMTLDHGLLEEFARQVLSDWERAYDSRAKKSAAQGRDARLTPQEMDLSGTAVGDGIVAAVSRLEPSKSKSKVVILLSDGSSNSGETLPLPAAELAQQFGVKVYTVGAGSNRRVPITQYDRFGRKMTAMNRFPLDEETLKAIAETTGAQYFTAQDRQGLDEVYRLIDELERTEIETKDYREWDERFQAWAFAALGLLLLQSLLAATVFRTIP